MSKSKTGREILILTVKLFVICVAVAGILAYVNSVTAPMISANEQTEFELSMAEVLPGAKGFERAEEFEFTTDTSGVILNGLYKADNGYVVDVISTEGYGGDVSVMVGITNDCEIAAVKIMSMSETPGLGAKAGDAAFTDQYKGLSPGIGIEKNNGGDPKNNTISAISGATVTTKAVTSAVNLALDVVKGGGTNAK